MGRQVYIKETEIPARVEDVFKWHEEPGAVERLTPPWERVEMVERAESLRIGTRVIFKVFMGPIPQKWVAEHVEYDPPRLFVDRQIEGPFAFWLHRHRFEPTEWGTTRMIDEVEYQLPLGILGELFGGAFTKAKLKRMFDYRHKVVLEHFRKARG